MTDLALPGLRTNDVASAAARARVRSRYRAEARFKLYGLLAISVTALFLAVVLADIFVKGIPAFFQNSLVANVLVDREDVDPQGTNDPATIRSGDFQLLAYKALRAQFPDVTDRANRRRLDALLSSGAADALRNQVVANPSLVGQTVKVPLLFSDDVDLYFKGIGTDIVRRTGRGTLSVSGTNGDVSLSSSSNDFQDELNAIRKAMAERARGLRNESDRLKRAVRSIEATRADLTAKKAANPGQAATLDRQIEGQTAEVESLTQRVQQLDQDAASLQARFDATSGGEALDDKTPSLLISVNGGLVRASEVSHSSIKGEVLIPLQSAADASPAKWQVLTFVTPESNRRISDREVAWLEVLRDRGLVERSFNWAFFTSGDSREPELAGIRGALVGSFLTLLVTIGLCLPIGVAAAMYLEEFAPKNRLTELVEININNLAAVPSIVFGLLGLAVFLNFFNLPRSAPLVGGLVLALLVLPTIIIAARAALKAVPPSIKEAALGVGASHQQAVFHHVLPLAMPGIMTGTIIGMAHALGETAPLLMIGMVAFIVEVPQGITSAATVLPVQIYLWSDLPEIAFQAKTAAAIIVLLAFLFVMNGAAIILRRQFERRW